MKPKVLFIGGAGRSGSTLLDRLVGEVHGFFSAGEISRLWRDALRHGGRCGCGEEIDACPTWGEILDRVHSGFDVDVREACRLQERMVRPLTDPRSTVLSPVEFVGDLDTYKRLLTRLYRSISEVSGARVIVDSSKEARHAWLLSTLADVDLRMIQLVRDSRAVAYSWQRRKFDPGRGDRMIRRGPIRTALEWNLVNELVLWIGRRHGPFVTLRYDDLVTDPREALEEVLRCVGEEATGLPLDDRGRVEMGNNHMAAGNPVRFERGSLEIRADDEWTRAMPSTARRVVGALTWPVLRRYGFVERGRAAIFDE